MLINCNRSLVTIAVTQVPAAHHSGVYLRSLGAEADGGATGPAMQNKDKTLRAKRQKMERFINLKIEPINLN